MQAPSMAETGFGSLEGFATVAFVIHLSTDLSHFWSGQAFW